MDYVIAYGTMMFRPSLARTLGEKAMTDREFIPVIVHGHRRLYNVRPRSYHSTHRISGLPIERGAGNSFPLPGSAFNGVAFPVTPEELATIDRRESEYERVRVDARRFFEPGRVVRAWFYRLPPPSPLLHDSTAALLPNWRDICLPRAGCLAYGREFLAFFDATTYLADGRTLMTDYYRARVPAFDLLTTQSHRFTRT